MFPGSKSSFTLKAEETAERAAIESSQQLAAFTQRTQYGVALAKEAERARELAKYHQAFQDISHGTTSMAQNLATALELQQPTPLLLASTAHPSSTVHSASSAQLKIEHKFEPDNSLKELDKDVRDLEKELSRLDAQNDTSETAYNNWLKEQQVQLEIHAEPTAVGTFKFDSYEKWKEKIESYQQTARNKLLLQLTEARENRQLSYDELKLAQRDYDVAFHRKYVELTKDHRMSMSDATDYLNRNFIDEKTFYRELYNKDIQSLTIQSKHQLTPVITKIVKGESVNLEDAKPYTDPMPSGVSSVVIDHSNRLFTWYLERAGINKDHFLKQFVGGAKIVGRALRANPEGMVAVESIGLIMDNFKTDPAEIEQARNELDIAINAARKMIPLEAGRDINKVNAFYNQLDEYLVKFQGLETPSAIRDVASLLLLQNQNARIAACEKIESYKQQRKSYAQPHFF